MFFVWCGFHPTMLSANEKQKLGTARHTIININTRSQIYKPNEASRPTTDAMCFDSTDRLPVCLEAPTVAPLSRSGSIAPAAA